jgi:high frequency lysogenization protein
MMLIIASEAPLLTVISPKYSQWEYQNLAMAGVAQCAYLVDSLANGGGASEYNLAVSINPLLALNPSCVEDVYSSAAGLGLGLRTLQNIFSNEKVRENTEVIRYTLGIMNLRGKLISNERVQGILREKLQIIAPLDTLAALNFSGENEVERKLAAEQIYQQLADLYQDTISTLSYRIQVQGKIDNLKDKDIANRIRALLLAGIRSAVLWHQLGGRRWHLVFYRKRILLSVGKIRRKLISPV